MGILYDIYMRVHKAHFNASSLFIPEMIKTNEPPHDKTNKMACVPSEDSDQLRHSPSLIIVFTVRSVVKGPMFLHADSEDSDQTGRMPRLI